MSRLEVLRNIAKRRGVAMAIAVVAASPVLMLWLWIGAGLERAGAWMQRVVGA